MAITVIITFPLAMLGGWLKIIHADGAENFLTLGLLSSLFLVIIFGIEAAKAKFLKQEEKLWWLVGFLLFGWFAAILYLIKYRRLLTRQ